MCHFIPYLGVNNYCHSVTTVTVKMENKMNNVKRISLSGSNTNGAQNLIDSCINATQTYLKYSSQKESLKQGKSQDIINVLSCTPKITEDGVEVFELEVSKVLKSNEFLIRDKHNNKEYIANEDFVVLVHDRNNFIVTIRFNSSYAVLNTGTEPNIELSFDLRILIVNQEVVFKSHSMDIACPTIQPVEETKSGYQYVETFTHECLPIPNLEQKEAITTMLTSPLSFFEGPPGVGKTITLAIPVLSYIAASKPVVIITPTKVSLERSMSAVIDLCRAVGMDTNKIIRFGNSSSWYAEKYPETLEVTDSSEFIQKEKLDLLLLEIALEYKGMKGCIDKKREIMTITMLIDDLLLGLYDLFMDKYPEGSAEHINLHKMIAIKIKNIQMNVNSEALIKIFENLNYRNYNDVFSMFNEYEDEVRSIRKMNPLTKKERDLIRINNMDYSFIDDRAELYEEFIGVKYDHMSESAIKAEIAIVSKRIESFKKEYSDKKREDALLLGMTADSYNSRYKNEPINVHHIFIDEGGYLPLIKAYGMCRENIPISILGDSMQLAPVFELDKDIKNDTPFEPLFLYDLNSFYLATLFSEGYDGLKQVYFNDTKPSLAGVPKVVLKHTYRFGTQLADILDQYVYKNGFTSAVGNASFKIEHIDAVNMYAPAGGRVNPAECNAIEQLLQNGIGGSVAILTPYKNQVSYLQKELKGLIDTNQIMSIHKSQGQEWETVIISVVDFQVFGAYGMWFTSTQNKKSDGLKVINTAVSRAKKRLIIVGHSRFWKVQKEELIGELFRCSEKLELEEIRGAA